MALSGEEKSTFTPASFPLGETQETDVFISGLSNEKCPVAFFGGYTKIVSVTDNKTITEQVMALLLNVTRQITDKTITLPDAAAIKGMVITINVIGSSAGNILLAGTGAQTINGILISSWVWEGAGVLTIVSDGSNFTALNTVWDSAVKTNYNFKKYTDGTARYVEKDTTYKNIDLGAGNPYYTAIISFSVQIGCVEILYTVSSIAALTVSDVTWSSVRPVQPSTVQIRGFSVNNAVTILVNYEAVIRWV